MADCPVRFTVMTYNIWATSRWPDREAALKRFLELHQPDILCLQELRPETRAVIDAVLPGHRRVEDKFEGWIREGNIYFNTDLFTEMAHGAEDIGMIEEARRLFWVRLACRFAAGRSLCVSTAHYTWIGDKTEREGGASPRPTQARRTVQALKSVATATEPVLFMGDLNDFGNPIRILCEGGLCDCFSALGRDTRYTHPANPTSHGTPQSIDWIFHRGPVRPMTSEVVDYYLEDLAPSDHKPVLATYRLV
jgi:endonuclease/exonuclease/phosphatase (EEP) superfamily protein YafD